MPDLKNKRYLLIIGILIFTLCSSRTVMHPSPGKESSACPRVIREDADTTAYTINFSDSTQKQHFVHSFQLFLDQYKFSSYQKDTISGQVVIRLAPFKKGESIPSLVPVETGAFSESTVEGEDFGDSNVEFVPYIDTIIPDTGGCIRLHLTRNSIDGTFIPLMAAPLLEPVDTSVLPLFSVSMTSARKIIVKLESRVVDGTGRLISALDIIEAWTGYIRQHPAEGFALFRYVDGVMDFIQGKEAVVRGFGAMDQYTCYLKLFRPDRYALDRLKSKRALGIYSKLGLYYPVKAVNKEMLLLANNKTNSTRRGLLDTLIINISDDDNPILSFSLKKYDALTLTFIRDISYARSTLTKQAAIEQVSQDRYFISCILKDLTTRKYIASCINAQKLIQTTLKVEGSPITSITSDVDTLALSEMQSKNEVAKPPENGQIRILFRDDDEISVKIANKLQEVLSSKSGAHISLVGAGSTEYERKLIEQDFECAIGWVEKRVIHDKSEKLRCATMFFRDMVSEMERIESYLEIPLCSVNRYLLTRKPAGMYRNLVTKIYASYRLRSESSPGSE